MKIYRFSTYITVWSVLEVLVDNFSVMIEGLNQSLLTQYIETLTIDS